MPLFFQQDINETTRLAVWKIEEDEAFFRLPVPLRPGINHPHKKLQHMAGRYLLPFLFSDFPTEEILVADTRKPFLPNEQYHFSISHCADYVAAIVSKKYRVGIDVERITSRIQNIKKKFLHPDEMRFVNSQHQQLQLPLLTVLWSAKEAMFKWYGEGEVDFSEMMRIFPFKLAEKGNIDAAFMKHTLHQKLLLDYKVFDETTLVWTVSHVLTKPEEIA